MPAPTFLDLARSIDRQLHGNIQWPVRAVTAAGVTALTADDRKVTVDATLGNVTINLPSAVVAGAGMDFEIKRLDATANTVTIQSATGGQTIDGAATYLLSKQYASALFMSNGTNYLSLYSPSLDMAVAISNVLTKNIRFPFRAIAVSGPVTVSDFYLTLDATAGAVVATLPSAATVGSGVGFSFMRIDGSANAVSLATTGGQTINGASSASITLRYGVLVAVSDGTNWLLFSSPGAFALATDVFWTFPAQLSVDQNTNLYTLVAERAMSFVGVDMKLNVSPVGASVIVDWEINGVVNSNLRMTIAPGATFVQVAFPFALAINDTLHPIVIQVGSQTPGQAGLFRSRGQ